MASDPVLPADDRALPAAPESWRLSPHVLRGPSIRPRRSEARVRIFNVKYSPNLGDGLLSECLERALIGCGAAADTWSVDLAARTGFGAGSSSRAAQLQLLNALPSPLRRMAVRAPLAIQSHRLWRPHYRSALEGADCVVIGGGNLFADLDLNFPTKIALAVEEACRRNLPVFIYGCGVSTRWSARGRALLEGALRRKVIRRVFVRDERSRQGWNDLAGSAWNLEATLVRDPGLLAADCYGLARHSSSRDSSAIGINVTSHLALRYHSDRPPSSTDLDAWYLNLARALLDRGHRVAVFSNGSPEDRACVQRLRPAFQGLCSGPAVSFPDARTPRELTRLICGFNAIVAFRMHAVIAAYACGVPFLALAWDPKVEAFLRSVDRENWLCRPVRTSGKTAAEHVLRAMRAGIPDAEREQVVTQAWRGVAMLQEEIAQALAGR